MGIHAIEKRQLSAKGMLEKIRSAFEKIPEPPRSTRGLKSNISAADCLIDLLHNQGSVDFSVLLSRFSSQIRGVISTTSILPHEFDSKIGQNNPKTRANPWLCKRSNVRSSSIWIEISFFIAV